MDTESSERQLQTEGNRLRWPTAARAAALVAAILALALFAYSARGVENYPGEVAFSSWLQSWRTSWLDGLMAGVSLLGDEIVAAAFLALAAVLLFIKGRRDAAMLIVAAPLVAFVARTVLKAAVARPRPSDDLVDIVRGADGYSFPSGHVMHYVVFLGVLLFTVTPETGRVRWLVQAGAAAAMVMVGISRVYLGAHWAGDVVAGYAFGGAVLLAAIWSWRRWSAARDSATNRRGQSP